MGAAHECKIRLTLSQTQAGRGVLWEKHDAGAESHLQRLLQERGQETPAGRLPYPDRPAGGVPAPVQHPVQPPARVVSPITGTDQSPAQVMIY